MAPLTKDRNTPRLECEIRSAGVVVAILIFAGAIGMRDASGDLVNGQTATGLVGGGRTEERADNSAGSVGDIS